MLAIKDPNAVVGKLRNIGQALALAMLVVVTVLLAAAGTGLVDRLHVSATLVRVLVPLLLLGVIVLISAALFRALARERIGWRAALAGGGVSGVILLITPTIAGYYTRWVANNTPVKLFLVLAGVLVTCYVVAFGLLLGSAVAARMHLGHALGAPGTVDEPTRHESCKRCDDRSP
jgi:uncharacterized BrkB/YihY/UPF0761 family membrane protein